MFFSNINILKIKKYKICIDRCYQYFVQELLFAYRKRLFIFVLLSTYLAFWVKMKHSKKYEIATFCVFDLVHIDENHCFFVKLNKMVYVHCKKLRI